RSVKSESCPASKLVLALEHYVPRAQLRARFMPSICDFAFVIATLRVLPGRVIDAQEQVVEHRERPLVRPASSERDYVASGAGKINRRGLFFPGVHPVRGAALAESYGLRTAR